MGMNTASVQRLYVAYFNRPADPVSLAVYEAMLPTDRVATQAELAVIAETYFSPSAEYTTNFAGQSNSQIVNQLYLNIFGRSAEAEGLISWATKLTDGSMTVAELALQLSYSAQGTDLAVVSARIDAATTFTTGLDTAGEITGYSGNAAAAQGKAYLAQISGELPTTDAAVTALKDAAVASVDTSIASAIAAGSVAAGSTFSLTTNADSLTGTGNNDTFNSILGASATRTLTSGDVVTGGAGTDTLSVTISGANTDAASDATGFATSGVEVISVADYNTDPGAIESIDLVQAPGVTTLQLAGSNADADLEFTNVTSLVDAVMTDGSGDLDVNYTAAAVAGSADQMTVTLKGQTGGSFEVNTGIETLNVVSNQASNTVTYDETATDTTTTINVSGDKNATIVANSTTVKTMDASSATGAVDFTTTANNDLVLTGGSGNDTFTLTTGTFDKDDTVDGGAGSDTVEINTAVAGAAALAGLTNVEILSSEEAITLAADTSVSQFVMAGLATKDLTLNTGYTQDTSVTLNATTDVVNSANVTLDVTVKADTFETGDAATITGGTGTDTLNVSLDKNGVDIILTGGTGGATGVDSVVIGDHGDGAAGATNALGVNIEAGYDVTVTTGTYTTALTIDGSALDAANADNDSDGDIDNDDSSAEILTVTGTGATAALNVIGGGAGDSITTGSANDTVDGGAGNDTITSTAGNDTLSGGAGNDTFVMTGLTASDTIDGGDGTDTLQVTSLVATSLTGVTNVENIKLNSATAVSLATDLSFTTIDLTDPASGNVGPESLTLALGYTAETTVKMDAGDTLVNTGADAVVTVVADADDLEAADSTTVTGSDKVGVTNSMTITTTGEGTADVVATSSQITGIDAITVVDNGDAASGLAVRGKDFHIDLASYATALTIDASSLDIGTTDADLDGKFGDETNAEQLVITGTAGKALNVTGGAADDTIIGSSDAATGDTLSGGTGDDTFTMADNLTYLDTIDGGAGADTVSLSDTANDTIDDIDFQKMTNVETVTIDSDAAIAVTLSSYFDATGVSTIALDPTHVATVVATGVLDGLSFLATGAQNENVTGGQGNDTFVFNEAGTLDASDTVNGGVGTDTILIDNTVTDGTDFSATIGLAGVTGVEKVAAKSANGGNTAASPQTNTVSVTFSGESTAGIATDNATDNTDVAITVDFSNITDTSDTVTVTAADIGDTDYSFTMLAGASAATLTGSAGADTLTGGSAADTLDGNAGADTMTGNAGADTFAFAEGDSTSAKTATIADFTASSDSIQITLVADSATSTIDARDNGDADSISAGLALFTASDEGQYFFNKEANQLAVDLDGNGLIQATDLIVNLTGETGVSSADINFIVELNGAGTGTVITGSGDDIVKAQHAELVAADTLSLGAGTNTVQLIHDTNTTNTFIVDMDNVSGVTKFSFTDVDGFDAGADTMDITFSAITETTAQTITVDASAVTDASDILTITNSSARATTTFNITGGAGADVLVGGLGADTLIGGTGADTLTGGVAADTLTGDAGNDLFVITTGITADTITDFTINEDDIDLDLSELNTASQITASETDTLVQFEDAAAPTDLAANTATAVATIANDSSDETALDNKNIILLHGGATTFANVGTAVDAFEVSGSFTMTHKTNIADDDSFIFAYENSTTGKVHIAVASFEAADDHSAGAATIADGLLKGTDLVILTGVTDVTTLDADDFDFI